MGQRDLGLENPISEEFRQSLGLSIKEITRLVYVGFWCESPVFDLQSEPSSMPLS